jgi:hypothetical protein
LKIDVPMSMVNNILILYKGEQVVGSGNRVVFLLLICKNQLTGIFFPVIMKNKELL